MRAGGEGREGEGKGRGEGGGGEGMGGEEAGSPPKLKLGPTRTIFLAPALSRN